MSLKKFFVLSLCALSAFSIWAEPIPESCKTGGFAVGCQAWTFNHFSVFEAIEKTAAAGGKVIEFFPGQKLSPDQPDVKFDHNVSDEIIDKVKAKLAENHIKAVNYGVVGISKNEAEARKVFEFAKKFGLYGITTESTDALDTIEKLVKEYDIRVGIHNHPRRVDQNYKVWDPKYVLSIVKDRDSRIGSTADIGHWVRSGLNPVECLKILEGRIISTHLKDLNEKSSSAHDVPYGTGISNIPAVLDELKRQKFVGNISVEYEYNWEHNVTDAAQCIGFVRGYAAQ
ncbi:MAG TPA: sugar phosphate isomerase/epimerase [Verrucomicrobiae bacterium]|jgi:sugar phosphate isomerase/epimerase|nr:sugar phosphate isomerase/epimerase [Verrucomicrobiae bacterium]